ncbi:hypothetical protein AY599_10490 [Leptolyngbya valderiana BDU 20041]|nr:hypothetical protein AY599_10490 [Leptolyngbya valderiana BDU 20041]
MRIDACANSVRKLPMAPTFEDPFRKLSYGAGNLADRYEFVEEDLREVYAYAWQRGADEFLLFNFGFPSEPGEPTPEGVPFQSLVRSANVAQWLRDTVHATAQYHQDHAARTGRLARRSM